MTRGLTHTRGSESETGSGNSATPGSPDARPPQPLPQTVRCSLPLDDKEFLEIAMEFVDVLGKRLVKMRDAVRRDDHARLQWDAHWLKGVSGNAGFDALVGPASALESSAARADTAACRCHLTQIETLAERIDLSGHVAGSASDGPPGEDDQEAITTVPLDADPGDVDDDGPIESALCIDDPELCDIVVDFVDSLHRRIGKMRRAQRIGDLRTLSRDAHWLRGTSASAGFDQFVLPAQALEVSCARRNFGGIELVLADIESLSRRISVPTGTDCL